MQIMPAIPYDRVMGFTWPELRDWHASAVAVYGETRGID